MINLLPYSEKQNLLEEEKWRMTLILGLIFLIFFISLTLIFISVSFSISSQAEAQKIILDYKKQEFYKTEVQELKNEIARSNQDLAALDDFYKKRISFIPFLEKISGLLPAGIYLDNISINPIGTENNSFQVSLSGMANFREDIITFNENLKKDKSISQISFPGNIWLEATEVNFNVTFWVTF